MDDGEEEIKTALSHQKNPEDYESKTEIFKYFLRGFILSGILLSLTVAIGILIYFSLSRFEQFGELLYELAFLSITAGMFMSAAASHYPPKYLGDVSEFNYIKSGSMFVYSGIGFLVLFLFANLSQMQKLISTERYIEAFNLVSMPLALIAIILWLFTSLTFAYALTEFFYTLHNSNLMGGDQKNLGRTPNGFTAIINENIPAKIRTFFGLYTQETLNMTPQYPENDSVSRKEVAKFQDVLQSEEEVQFIAKATEMTTTEEDSVEKFLGFPWLIKIAILESKLVIKKPGILTASSEEIKFENLVEANAEFSRFTGIWKKLTIKTNNSIYEFDITAPLKEELEKIEEYLESVIQE